MMGVLVGFITLTFAVEDDDSVLKKPNEFSYYKRINNNGSIHYNKKKSIYKENNLKEKVKKDKVILRDNCGDSGGSELLSKKPIKTQLTNNKYNSYKQKKRHSKTSKKRCGANRMLRKKLSSRKKLYVRNKNNKRKLKNRKNSKSKKVNVISKLSHNSKPQRFHRRYINKGRFFHPNSINSRLYLDGKDEWNGRGATRCNQISEISCPFKCISSNRICDGVRDCIDGSDEKNCKELEIGLYGGKGKGEGRVEITMNGFRGTVCSRGWTDKDASVYCKMLGYGNVAKAVNAKKEGFGSGDGLVWSTIFKCKGDEKDLFKCPLYKRKINCSHLYDAGVICNAAISVGSSVPKQQCGVKSIKHPLLKVLGGQRATYGSQPWQARLLLRKKGFTHLCGASIIDEQWIVTAAHCLKKFKHDDIAVVVGDHSLIEKDGKEQVFGIEKMFVHPMFTKNNIESEAIDDYFNSHLLFVFPFRGRSYRHSRATASSFKNDIALLKIEAYKKRRRHTDKIKFNKHVQPICLPDHTTPYKPGQKCEIAGWGYNGKSKKASMELQVAKLSLIKKKSCEKAYVPMFFQKLPSQMVCAGSVYGNADTCQGDSGGPLACKVNGVYTLLGVTSWGYECGESFAPGIYTKVGLLREWIDQIRQKN